MSAAALLVFARSAGFVARAPGFSHPSVPHAVRAGLALVLAIAVLPAVTRVPHVDGAALVLALAVETGIGAAIGFSASLLYDGAYAGGRALDDYVGIRGSVPNAQIYAASGFGRIWSSLFTAGYFLLGGYRIVIQAFAANIERLPPGTVPDAHSLLTYALKLPVTIVQAALLVAAPAIAIVFVAQVSLGALTRVIPRFAAFSLSFPIVFALALAATLLVLPIVFAQSGSPVVFDVR